MPLSSEDLARMFKAASMNIDNPISGEEAQNAYRKIQEEISQLDARVMPSPSGEWADDSDDELLDATDKAWGEFGNRVWDKDVGKDE